MTQPEFKRAMLGDSQETKIIKALIAANGGWVSMRKLGRVSGSMNVHSRIAALRKRGHVIPNKCDRSGRVVKSFYRLAQ